MWINGPEIRKISTEERTGGFCSVEDVTPCAALNDAEAV